MRVLTESGRAKMASAKRTHGMSRTKVHDAWKSMHARCYRPSTSSYQYYGGRGINVCARWARFEDFYADMGDPPQGTSLDRLDSNGDYSPDNCRWATPTEQSRNRSMARPLTVNGVTKLLCDWVKETGVKRTTIIMRLKRGWTTERAIFG